MKIMLSHYRIAAIGFALAFFSATPARAVEGGLGRAISGTAEDYWWID